MLGPLLHPLPILCGHPLCDLAPPNIQTHSQLPQPRQTSYPRLPLDGTGFAVRRPGVQTPPEGGRLLQEVFPDHRSLLLSPPPECYLANNPWCTSWHPVYCAGSSAVPQTVSAWAFSSVYPRGPDTSTHMVIHPCNRCSLSTFECCVMPGRAGASHTSLVPAHRESRDLLGGQK